ncbi:hypothetical protein AD947_02615 [Acetobacter tropicalis]|uniref:Uncharacterized protein n=1 Tax=Acetobacter tropicalis TaxID=104102 RepID=A0A149U432_9PROT|nr:hypothetical protein [Acetobacter tropicalis]KXV60225.1 hypothetical protein AD947_02615 [Acetobacter tropicalis]
MSTMVEKVKNRISDPASKKIGACFVFSGVLIIYFFLYLRRNKKNLPFPRCFISKFINENMTLNELFEELSQREALIVHCSTQAKSTGTPLPGSVARAPLYYPNDMITAKGIFETGSERLCCSIIWPKHSDTWGDIGLVVKPHNVGSILDVCSHDAGSPSDATLGQGYGKPFTKDAVMETFEKSSGEHNEWGIKGAEVIGIFVKYSDQLPIVATQTKLSDRTDYDPTIPDQIINDFRCVAIGEITSSFPGLPILTFKDGKIVEITPTHVLPYSDT